MLEQIGIEAKTASWLEVCSLKIRFPFMSVSDQYGLEIGDFIIPVEFP